MKVLCFLFIIAVGCSAQGGPQIFRVGYGFEMDDIKPDIKKQWFVIEESTLKKTEVYLKYIGKDIAPAERYELHEKGRDFDYTRLLLCGSNLKEGPIYKHQNNEPNACWGGTFLYKNVKKTESIVLSRERKVERTFYESKCKLKGNEANLELIVRAWKDSDKIDPYRISLHADSGSTEYSGTSAELYDLDGDNRLDIIFYREEKDKEIEGAPLLYLSTGGGC